LFTVHSSIHFSLSLRNPLYCWYSIIHIYYTLTNSEIQ